MAGGVLMGCNLLQAVAFWLTLPRLWAHLAPQSLVSCTLSWTRVAGRCISCPWLSSPARCSAHIAEVPRGVLLGREGSSGVGRIGTTELKWVGVCAGRHLLAGAGGGGGGGGEHLKSLLSLVSCPLLQLAMTPGPAPFFLPRNSPGKAFLHLWQY